MTGDVRGQSQLRQAFEFTNSYALPQPEMLVARAHEKFDTQGQLTDQETRQHLRCPLGALAQWTIHFLSAPRV
jgi:chromate reductase, NAD(P)H dehydrogenase (quinone)